MSNDYEIPSDAFGELEEHRRGGQTFILEKPDGTTQDFSDFDEAIRHFKDGDKLHISYEVSLPRKRRAWFVMKQEDSNER